MVVERGVEPEEGEKMVVHEKPVSAVETYNSDSKTPHNDSLQNEIVAAAVVEELILDLTAFRQRSKQPEKMTLTIREEKGWEKREPTLISNNCIEMCWEY